MSNTPLNAFDHVDTSGLTVTIDSGEAFIGGAWLARDTQTDVTLTSGTSNQTVHAGWSATSSNTVRIDTSGAFGGNDPSIPIWTFDTDSSGVTSSANERSIGEELDIKNSRYETTDDSGTEVDSAKLLKGNDIDGDADGVVDDSELLGGRSLNTVARDVRTITIPMASIPANDFAEVRVRRPSGSVDGYLLQTTNLNDSNNAPTDQDVVVLAGDGTELYRSNEEVDAGSVSSPLGGAWDRVYLEFRLENNTSSEIDATATFTILFE